MRNADHNDDAGPSPKGPPRVSRQSKAALQDNEELFALGDSDEEQQGDIGRKAEDV